jgi:GNAT superfamily N-acetyltransferase
MMTERTPLFCDAALAERIERADTQLVTEASRAAHRRNHGRGFVLPLAGGVASFAEPGSPFNKVAGLGFAGVPDAAYLDEIERAFAACDAPVQVELPHLADPGIGVLLTERGYRLESFENVLGRALGDEHERVTPPGIEVRRSGDEEFDAWLDVAADGVAHPDAEGVPWHEEFPREIYIRAERDMDAAGVVRYAALRDGVLAGAAGLRLAEGVAQFAGAATAPAHRRHGIQAALLSARLVDAAAAGCDVAVVVTQPGSKSQQNAQRRGFALLYTRAVLVKHGGFAAVGVQQSHHAALTGTEPEARIELHAGARSDLRSLFELAEDSPTELDSYLHDGRVLVARSGDDLLGHLQLVETDRPGRVEIKNMAVLEAVRGRGIGARLVRAALDLAAAAGADEMVVATGAADVGNLRFYQRQGFRFRSVERDAFGPATGYPPGIVADGIPLRDRVCLDQEVGPPA